MTHKQILSIVCLVALLGSLLAACGAQPEATTAPTSQPAAPTSEPTAAQPAAEAPTELNVAAIFISPVEEPWNTSWLQAMERIEAEKPHGLTINVDYTENVAPPDAERVLRQYADTGNYQIIWAHSAYPDAIMALKDEYPDILWAYAGSGYEPIGGNTYWADVYGHEPAYLAGMIAGLMTKSNVIGAVAAFPYPNVNLPVNAYVAGAQAVNPDVEAKVTYIESWFDPPKAKESAAAQIAAGADFIYAERFGPFEACNEAGVLCFGHFVDQSSILPEVVVTSAMALWDPSIKTIIDAWWAHVTEGTPYNGPMERLSYFMEDGGAELAPYYAFADTLPQEVMDQVEQARQDILSGKLEVPFNEQPFGESTTPPAETEGPAELNIGAIFSSAVEQPWCTSLLQTVERLKAEKPHGLTINFDYTENVAPPDAERVLRQYADSGKYQILWAHSAYYDAVNALRTEYPEILWVGAGSGYEPMSDNAYRIDVFTHEPAYLAGVVAGAVTKNNVIGAVAAFPFSNVNIPLNAYIEGARSVNPDVKVKVTYIESWFDPPKAKESAAAQIATGADIVYAERFGPFEACREAGVLCLGHFVDQNSLAPDVVVTSPMALWDPTAKFIIDTWWAHVTEGTPYDAPGDRIVYYMKDGGSDLAPFYGFADSLPAKVLQAVEDAKAKIMSGEIEVPLNEAPIESD